MIFFWVLYSFISFAISYLISSFFKLKFLKIFVFSLVFSLSFSVWFIKPGSGEIAPVTSIFLMELFIVEEHGFLRLLRPIIAIFILCITFITFYNFLFRKK